MNLYVLVAIALGALTGVTDVAVARPAAVMSRRAGAGTRRRTVAAAEIRYENDAKRGARRWRPSFAVPRAIFRAVAPLIGAATPRAPATNC